MAEAAGSGGDGGPSRPAWRLQRSLSMDNIDKVDHPPKWIRERFPTKKLAAKPYLPGFSLGASLTLYRFLNPPCR